MRNKVHSITESRIHGDMYVRFGGRFGETCGSNAVRRSEPSLQNGDQDVKKTIMLTIGAVLLLSHCPRHCRCFSNNPLKKIYRMTMNHEGYPVFKGLQKPLEFMGIRGRFLTLAAGAIGVSFVGFIGFSIVLGKLAGFIAMLVMALAGLVTIFVKQRGGLHNKRRSRGIFVYRNLRKKS